MVVSQINKSNEYVCIDLSKDVARIDSKEGKKKINIQSQFPAIFWSKNTNFSKKWQFLEENLYLRPLGYALVLKLNRNCCTHSTGLIKSRVPRYLSSPVGVHLCTVA